MSIAICFPTRNRPQNLQRLYKSLQDTSKIMPQVCIYVDDDDEKSIPVAKELGIIYLQGPRQTYLGKSWNMAADLATADIICAGGDDLVFRTKDWDVMVEEEFAKWSDRIVQVHGDDKCHGGSRAGTHGFLHQNWIRAIGYMYPPYFETWPDNWVTAVANNIQRRVFIPIITEHIHPTTHGIPMDDTYSEARPKQHADRRRFEELKDKRQADCDKLRVLINFNPVFDGTVCPVCFSTCIVPVSGQLRCNQCGTQFK